MFKTSRVKQLLSLFVVSAFVAIAGIALAPDEGASAGSRPACDRSGARQIARTTSAVVYRRPARPANPGTFVCADARGKDFWLGDGRGRERFLGPLTLVGSRVAFGLTAYENTSEDLATQEVRVKSARTGRVLVNLPAVSVPDPESPAVAGGVKDIGLSEAGALAWIAADVSVTPASYEVWVADRRGPRMVAKGTDVNPRSLAISRDLVYWSRAGDAHQTSAAGAARR